MSLEDNNNKKDQLQFASPKNNSTMVYTFPEAMGILVRTKIHTIKCGMMIQEVVG